MKKLRLSAVFFIVLLNVFMFHSAGSGEDITESFETGTKAAYAIADVTLSTGAWSFDDALLNNDGNDKVNGENGARIRANGSVSTKFTVSGVREISFYAGSYNNDPVFTNITVLCAAEFAGSWVEIGSVTGKSATLAQYEIIVPEQFADGCFKFSMSAPSGKRVNIDDITFKKTPQYGITAEKPELYLGDAACESFDGENEFVIRAGVTNRTGGTVSPILYAASYLDSRLIEAKSFSEPVLSGERYVFDEEISFPPDASTVKIFLWLDDGALTPLTENKTLYYGSVELGPDPGDPYLPPPDVAEYYADVGNKTGAELKAGLHDIIKGHKTYSYDALWSLIMKTDEDPDNPNNVILLYTGRSQSKALHGSGVNDWNREHVWAKSHGDFGTSRGPGTDLHHLRPADSSVNSSRGNKEFAEGGNWHVEATECKAASNSWEPRDAVKGDVARMIFYMAVRYEGSDGSPDLEVNNQLSNGSKPFHGKLSDLKKWNAQDPPDSFERNRNDTVYGYQGNRNPFIDHPEYVNMIWD